MRRKKEAVLSFESNDQGLPKVIRDYRARYRSISQVLDKIPRSWIWSTAICRNSPKAVAKAQGGLHVGEYPAGVDRAWHHGR